MNIEDLSKRRQHALIRIIEQGLGLSEREKKIMNNMVITPNAVIARVFHYDFQPRINRDDQRPDDIAKDNDYYTHAMPLAFVIKAGSAVKFDGQTLEYGDVIRLYDRKVRTMINPRHAAYYNNKMTDSNAERIGTEPSMFIHMVHENFRDRVFIIDHLKDPTVADFHTFNLPEPEILGLIKDPKTLLDGLDTLA
jgi:hypothetical protein